MLWGEHLTRERLDRQSDKAWAGKLITEGWVGKLTRNDGKRCENNKKTESTNGN